MLDSIFTCVRTKNLKVAMTEKDQLIHINRDNLGAIKGLPLVIKLGFRIITLIEFGSIIIEVPDGRRFKFGDAAEEDTGELIIHHPAMVRRVLTSGTVGFGESYIDGQWSSGDMAKFIEVFARNNDVFDAKTRGSVLMQIGNRIGHILNRNTKRGSRKNISAHYDLGNEFYAKWLDQSMTYSAARFDETSSCLTSAQDAKYRTLAQNMHLSDGHEVLEIGCGWGGFAEFAAKEVGCHVTGLTLSREQLEFAQQRIFKEGLNEKVSFKLQDYRDEKGHYDRIASIEMFEAVGEEYWPKYFTTLRSCLKDGGMAGLQIITIDDKYFQSYRNGTDFIQKYIFPGGLLPSPSALRQQVTDAGLSWVKNIEFGSDYARTLSQWNEAFQNAWPEIVPLGFDEKFRRTWTYYLKYCEGGFRSGNIDVTQISLAKV